MLKISTSAEKSKEMNLAVVVRESELTCVRENKRSNTFSNYPTKEKMEIMFFKRKLQLLQRDIK